MDNNLARREVRSLPSPSSGDLLNSLGRPKGGGGNAVQNSKIKLC